MNEVMQQHVLPINYLVEFQDSLRMAEEKYRNISNPSIKVRGLLKELVFFYGADNACVLETDWNLGIAVKTFVYHNDGIIPKIQHIIHLPMSECSGYVDKLRANQPLIIADEGLCKIKTGCDDETIWSGIQNMLVTPFMKRYSTGIIIVTNPKKYENNTTFLQLMCSMVVGDINEMKLQERLDTAIRHTNAKPEKTIYINFFGGLEIQSKGGVLSDEDISADQCYRLLTYLLFHHRRTKPVRELADIIWNDADLDDPYHDVKNVVYRLRKTLSKIDMAELIIGVSGTFAINPKCQIFTDYERFEKLCIRYFAGESDELKEHLFQEAQKLYKGMMLPKCDHLHWLMPKSSYYHNLFLRLVKDNIVLNLQKQDYLNALLNIQKGLDAEPYDLDFMVYQIICMDLQGSRSIAKSLYKRMERDFTKEQKELIAHYKIG